MFFVRTAGERDIAPIRDMLAAALHAGFDRLYGEAGIRELLETRYSPAALKACVKKKGGEFLLADDGRTIGGIGYAAMSEDMAKTVILQDIHVSPSCRRQGVGRDIFAELETCFPDAEIMRLEVDERNEEALAFFAIHGFTEVDRIAAGTGINAGFPVVVLEKPLET